MTFAGDFLGSVGRAVDPDVFDLLDAVAEELLALVAAEADGASCDPDAAVFCASFLARAGPVADIFVVNGF